MNKLFQSTRPRGAQHLDAVQESAEELFQSTRPRGARLIFNLRAAHALCVSIHAPARGATAVRGLYWEKEYVSIHAPARGAT